MTSDHGIHVGKPPFFDGNNYDYWKTRMSAHLKAMCYARMSGLWASFACVTQDAVVCDFCLHILHVFFLFRTCAPENINIRKQLWSEVSDTNMQVRGMVFLLL